MPTPKLPDIRQIDPADLNDALAQGWRDFKAKRGDLIVIVLLYPVICIGAAVVAYNDPLLPLLFPLVAGFSIAGPAAAAGFYELARRREEGRDASWRHFVDPLNGRSRTPLLVLTMLLALIFVAWLVVAFAIYSFTFGAETPMRIADFFGRLFTTKAGWQLIVIGNFAGLGFAVVTLAFAMVSFPMVVDKPVDAELAMRTSLAAARKNPAVVLRWGVYVAGLLLVGMIPLGIGLAVVLPWLGYATWHLYTKLIVR